MDLRSRLQAEMDRTPLQVSLTARDLRTGETIAAFAEDCSHPSASMIKVLILLEAFSRLEQGDFARDQLIDIPPCEVVDYSVLKELELTRCSYYELMYLMITTSDNTATNVLIGLLGYEQINRWCDELGLGETRLRRRMLDTAAVARGEENTTSTRDYVRIMELLYRREILSPQSCDEMVRILLQQRYNDCLPRYIFDPVRLAHKTGSLDYACHDGGIFYTSRGEYAVCVMTSGAGADQTAQPVIGRLSKHIYGAFIGEEA